MLEHAVGMLHHSIQQLKDFIWGLPYPPIQARSSISKYFFIVGSLYIVLGIYNKSLPNLLQTNGTIHNIFIFLLPGTLDSQGKFQYVVKRLCSHMIKSKPQKNFEYFYCTP